MANEFKVGNIVKPKNPKEFHDYWNRRRKSCKVKGITNLPSYTVSECGNSGVKLKELSFEADGGCSEFINSWFELVSNVDLNLAPWDYKN